MNIEVGSNEAEAKFLELLRGVRLGKSYTITQHGEAVAKLVPVAGSKQLGAVQAVYEMLAFMQTRNLESSIDLRTLINDGRT